MVCLQSYPFLRIKANFRPKISPPRPSFQDAGHSGHGPSRRIRQGHPDRWRSHLHNPLTTKPLRPPQEAPCKRHPFGARKVPFHRPKGYLLPCVWPAFEKQPGTALLAGRPDRVQKSRRRAAKKGAKSCAVSEKITTFAPANASSRTRVPETNKHHSASCIH